MESLRLLLVGVFVFSGGTLVKHAGNTAGEWAIFGVMCLCFLGYGLVNLFIERDWK